MYRERPEDLRGAGLALRVDYPEFEIIVVDNAPVATAPGTWSPPSMIHARRIVEPVAAIDGP